MALKRESGTPVEPKGNKQEQQTFRDVHRHYVTSKEDLEQRIQRKNGFDDADKFFAGHIDESNWPYRSLMFDPRPYTVINEKSARLIGSKPKGRFNPRENGDVLGAKICNELYSFQWDDNGRLGRSMIEKWIEMDQNARKYGSAFALQKWVYKTRVVKDDKGKGKREVYYDGPDMIVCNPRDVLANPSYSFVNKWFQYREYVTLDELMNVNDVAKGKPVYKNLDIVKQALRDEEDESTGKGDRRDVNYTTQNKSMRGLTDYLGSDEVYKTLEVITEYRPDRWITFVPRHGVVIRDIPNPYEHGEIPVVHLRYYPLADDLYGVNEFEPVSKLIRGINSLFSQYIDNIAIDLYPPLMINPVNVRMNTIEFTQEAKWLMNSPGVDVKRLETSTAATNNFQAAYSLMVSSLLNAWGETSQGISSVDPFQPDKTATEVRDTAFTRNVRDNMNQIYLTEAIKKHAMLWMAMNKQFLFTGADQVKVIRVVGREALDYFKGQGLADDRPTELDAEEVAFGMKMPEDIIPGPVFPVEQDGQVYPKLRMDETGNAGELLMEEGDLLGTYDYIPDIESMQAPSQEQTEQKLQSILTVITNPAIMQMLANEQKKPKVMELLVKLFESTKVIKDAESYFEDIQENVLQTNQAGAQAPTAGPAGQGDAGNPGMAGGNQALPGEQGPQFMG